MVVSITRVRLHLRHVAVAMVGLAGLIGGCASPNPTPPSAIIRVEPWTYDAAEGATVLTAHYVIYTTMRDEGWQENFAQLMEGALAQYARFAPDVALSQRPMECFVFASRSQWAAFTKEKTGNDAAVYLHITRGGYTVRDWFVAFNIGEVGTFSVAAHEGFHQFASRHFKTRIPPFLEEGIACMFENVHWDLSVPMWDLRTNPSRLASLRTAITANQIIPLNELIRLHAGQIVNGPQARIAAFYGESWAFAEFLWSVNHKKYRPCLQRLLTDAAAGKIAGVPSRPMESVFWNPATAKPLLEQYLGADLQTLDEEFHEYIARILAEPDNPD